METKEVLQNNAGFMSYWEYKQRRKADAKAKHDAIFRRNDSLIWDNFVIVEYGFKFAVTSFVSMQEIAAQTFHPDLHNPDLGVDTFDWVQHYAILYPNGYWEHGVYVYEKDPDMLGLEEYIYRKVSNSAFLMNYIIDQNKFHKK